MPPACGCTECNHRSYRGWPKRLEDCEELGCSCCVTAVAGRLRDNYPMLFTLSDLDYMGDPLVLDYYMADIYGYYYGKRANHIRREVAEWSWFVRQSVRLKYEYLTFRGRVRRELVLGRYSRYNPMVFATLGIGVIVDMFGRVIRPALKRTRLQSALRLVKERRGGVISV